MLRSVSWGFGDPTCAGGARMRHFVTIVALALSCGCGRQNSTAPSTGDGDGGSGAALPSGGTEPGDRAGAGRGVAGADTGANAAGTGQGGGGTASGGVVAAAGQGGATGVGGAVASAGTVANAGQGGHAIGGDGAGATAGRGATAGEAGAGEAGSAGAPPAVGKFVGNITFRGLADADGLTYSDHWDQITPEHAGKWGSVQARVGSPFEWAALDAIYDYAEESGIAFKQDNFVWGSQQPIGDITQADVQNWMQSFCDRYPHTRLIDVVSEPPPHTTPIYADAIGGGTDGTWQWIANAFVWAHAACPDAILLLDDYEIIENSDDNARIITIIKTIQSAGAPIDAVGAQGIRVATLPIATVKELMDDLHTETGLPLYITAYQVGDEDDYGQLQTYTEQFPTFLDTDYVHGITLRGWVYDPVWVDNYLTYLVRNGEPRPAMTWLMQRLGRPVP